MCAKYLRYDETELDEISLKKIKKEIREEEGSMERCRENLKTMLMSTKNLRPNLDENFLAYVLRLSKFDVKKAYSRILKMYDFKKTHSYLFDHELPSCTLKGQAAMTYHILPYRAPDNSIVVVRNFKHYEPDDETFLECYLIVNLCCRYLYKNPITQMCGVTILADMDGITLPKIWHFSALNKLKFWSSFQKVGPCRIPDLHVVNLSPVCTLFKKLFVSILPPKVGKRVHFHPNNDNWKSLHSYLPPEILPKQYGGHLDSMIDLPRMLNAEEEFFREELKYGFVDEE